jgi:hypothetical protein
MKYKNIKIDSKGQKSQTEHRINWTPTVSGRQLKFLGAGEEPIAVYYFQSGWNYGYPTYRVIMEFGDFEESDYLFLSEQEFVENFGVQP